ncbi:E3 ubiquitin-protein ligase NRDP1-like [Acropora millepora]|uniref:E3 ubiquitin-protein ligase NRDP1-like n=1 Tax=Acropora millepora TaxID=45264 RepID=UPI001CF35188|nr:E3 ubiquitin-protein ligase NRDP1-like [Acropora millepora]
MGYIKTIFISRVDHNLICGICAGVFEKPVAVYCGHTYCEECLEDLLRALERKDSFQTCPDCRRKIGRHKMVPVLALKGFIEGLCVKCENSSKGCSAVLQLGELGKHLRDCEYAAVTCCWCNGVLMRNELREHQAKCAKINYHEDHFDIPDHDSEITILKEELVQTKKELQLSEESVQRLQRSLRELRVRSRIRERQLSEDFDPAWDPDYGYGYSARSVVQLCGFISRFLNGRPHYVDQGRIFTCLKRCFDYFHNCAGFWQDLHMLLATAMASHWFTDSQRQIMVSWLKILAREKLLNSK